MSRPAPKSYGRADQWPGGPFPNARTPALQQAVQTVAALASDVRGERARRHWSQERLAREAGVSRDSVTRLETGSTWPDLLIIVQVCAALDMAVQFSIGRR